MPSLITSALSPPGPSVMLTSQWIVIFRFGPRAISSRSTVRMMLLNPRPRMMRSSSRVG